MSLLSRLRSLLTRPAPAAVPPSGPAPDIEVIDGGFRYGERTIRWTEVVRIRTYKLDFDTIDCVCLAFGLDAGVAVEVTEESGGFNDLADELIVAFPSIEVDWYQTVMTPAFARNETLLFEKAGAGSSAL